MVRNKVLYDLFNFLFYLKNKTNEDIFKWNDNIKVCPLIAPILQIVKLYNKISIKMKTNIKEKRREQNVDATKVLLIFFYTNLLKEKGIGFCKIFRPISNRVATRAKRHRATPPLTEFFVVYKRRCFVKCVKRCRWQKVYRRVDLVATLNWWV